MNPKAIGLVSVSGGGRGSLLTMLHEHYPQAIQIPGHTTRAPREGEIDGVHKHFVSHQRFLEMQDDAEFLETDHHHLFWYGTAKSSYDNATKNDHFGIFDIEHIGALEIKKQLGDAVVFIFIDIEGDSTEEKVALIEQRLRSRGTESDEKITSRIDRIPEELSFAKSFDHYVTNKQYKLDECFVEIRDILTSHAISPSGKHL